MKLIGDIHGDFEWYQSNVLEESWSSIQVGDYGVGFHPHVDMELDHDYHQHKCIAGNHDRRLQLSKYDCYLGDWNYFPEKDLFVLGGAASPWFDVRRRSYNRDWFPTEELDSGQFMAAYEAYCEYKPSYVITHTAPSSICERICDHLIRSKYMGGVTEYMLQFMFDQHQPKSWWYGHWHIQDITYIKSTLFQCININEIIDVPELGEW